MSFCRLLSAFAISCYQLLLLLSCAAADRQVRFDYIGCFQDYVGSVRDLNGLIGIQQWSNYNVFADSGQIYNESMTWQYCSSACSLGGFAFMGLQNGVACYCGNSYGSQGSGGTSCTASCSGNSAQICGYSSRNSVFALTYLDTNGFVSATRSNVSAVSSFPQPLYKTTSARSMTECAILCSSNCQAVIYIKLQGLCHLLKFALVPAALMNTDGEFYPRA